MSVGSQEILAEHTNKKVIQQRFQQQKQFAQIVKQRTAKERKKQLKRISHWIDLHSGEIREALFKDFQKPGPEADMTEIYLVQTEIRHALKQIDSWMKPEKIKAPLALTGVKNYIYHEPKGVCLIIAPWNFPFHLMLIPLVSAVAAGNCAILKPSELTPHTSRLIRNMMESLFEPEEVVVFEGDKEVAEELLKLPFDHIFFTGSPEIGKVVMRAAAENLSSLTLELGGKSPCIIDASANLPDAAEKIAWGKWMNSGQTCIAPDYLLVEEEVAEEFCKELKQATLRLFQDEENDIRSSADYARIINQRHFKRLKELLADALEKGAFLDMGGETRAEDNYIAPTLLREVPEEARLWEEEIFGPLLPVRTYTRLDDAIRYIGQKPKPLSLYLFSNNKIVQQDVLRQTTAGGVCINDCLLQYIQPVLPFGGINTSGLGKSHGKWGFLAFSNEKAVTRQRVGLTTIKPVYPPYTPQVKKLINLFVKYF